MGRLTFCFGSLHVYEDELHRIDRFLADDEATFRDLPVISWDSLDSLFSDWAQPVAGRHALQAFFRDQSYIV
ncbi:MAG: hypothetical protein LC776_00700 [Acidobacteria bacterium]|nr:hypothetical protein [Acidobacteriota bacterium]